MKTTTFGRILETYEKIKYNRDSMISAVCAIVGPYSLHEIEQLRKDKRPSVQMLLECYDNYDAQMKLFESYRVVIPENKDGSPNCNHDF